MDQAHGSTGARSGRAALLGLLAAALLLRLPSLATGLFSDDWVQHWTLEQGSYGPTLRPWALFDFGTAEGFERTGEELGGTPWWTATDWKVRFMRPVASLWIAAEHALSPCPIGHQVAGLGLMVVLLLLVRRLVEDATGSRRAALWAVAYLAVEESTHLPVAWTANRNSLLEAVFGVAALIAARDRARPWRTACVATALGLLALGSKESGGIFLLLLAGLLPPLASSRARHATRLLPLVALTVYVWAWKQAGHGSTSLFYPEPWAQPGVVLARATSVFTTGVAALLSPASLDLANFHPQSLAHRVSLAAGLLALLAVVMLARRARARPAPWALALLFGALALQAPAPPSDRLLLIPAIALAPWIGALLAEGRGPWRALLIAIAIGGSGVGLVARELSLVRAADEARTVHVAVARHPSPARHRLLLQLPNSLAGLGLGPGVRFAGGAEDLRPWPLRFGRGGIELEGLTPTSVRLTASDGPFLESPIEPVFATFEQRPGAGSGLSTRSYAHGPFQVEIEDAGLAPRSSDSLPPFRRLRLSLAPGTDPAEVGLFAWGDGELVEVPWPAPGERLSVHAARSQAPLAP